MNPDDLAAAGIQAGAYVTVSSRRGAITLRAHASRRIALPFARADMMER